MYYVGITFDKRYMMKHRLVPVPGLYSLIQNPLRMNYLREDEQNKELWMF